jgi:coatomer protein complex subunit gamma
LRASSSVTVRISGPIFRDNNPLTASTTDSMFSLPILEDQLAHYVNGSNAEAFADPFDFSNVPVVTREQSLAEDRTKKLTTATPTLKAPSVGPKKVDAASAAQAAANATVASQKYAQQLQTVPEFREYGVLLKSSHNVELTESETEYVVSAVKHLYKEHVVLQFDIKNTLSDYVLADVSVVCTPSAADDEDEDAASELVEDFIIPVPLLKSDEPGTVYVSFSRPAEPAFLAASFTNVLKFTLKEIDPTTQEPEDSGYEDEYQVEDLELAGADYVLPAFAGSWDNIWTGLADADTAEETLQLGNAKSIQDAVELLVKTLGMQPLEGSEMALSSSTHNLRLYGKSVGGGKVVAQVRMAYSARSGVTVKISVRSEEEGLAALVVGGVA